MIGQLIRNRYRPPMGSGKSWKYWAKRMRLLPQLIRSAWRIRSLTSRGATIGEFTIVSPADISGRMSNLSIGSHCAIGRVMIQLHDRVEIGNNVVINDGARVITGTHDVHSPGWEAVVKPIKIGDFVWIATGAIILPGVELGRGAVVAAGAVVAGVVPERAVVAGNPAREVSRRTELEFSYRPSSIHAVFEAWLGPVDVISK